MPKIHVVKGFNLLLTLSDRRRYEPGVHDVEPEVAAHWYTRENATVLADSPAAPAAEPPTANVAVDTGASTLAGSDGDAPAATAPAVDLLDVISDEELRRFITERDGKAPHPKTGREKLLAKAREIRAKTRAADPDSDATDAKPAEA